MTSLNLMCALLGTQFLLTVVLLETLTSIGLKHTMQGKQKDGLVSYIR